MDVSRLVLNNLNYEYINLFYYHLTFELCVVCCCIIASVTYQAHFMYVWVAIELL